MRAGVLIIAHNHIGQQLLETATDMLNRCPVQVRSLEVMQDDDPVDLLARARRLLADIDQGAGVLVLTDMYGSTPSNIAHRLSDHDQQAVRVLSGINLPMLVRALNYAELHLDELAQKALSGGREGILDARSM
ncbi:MAG: PTS fructose transporter subunit IIA [Halothiobacillaceae bacterium]|nr:MAG: PTS fructose transporter subunit IIA [Halothiobacillaceae bacterium]